MRTLGWLNDLVRVVNGFSLVAKEAVARQTNGRTSQTALKNTILSATNLTGLTKGRIRRVPPTSGNGEFERALYVAEESIPIPTTQSDSISSNSSVTSDQGFKVGDDDATKAFELRGETEVDKSAADVSPQGNSNGAAGLTNPAASDGYVVPLAKKQRKLRERKVPSTPFSRALGFAGLGAGLAWGTVQESAKRLVFGPPPNAQGNQSVVSAYLSEKNAERVALALCRMRGAALKLGQMLSIQDESLVPAPILAAFDIVRQGADVMPRSQLDHVLNAELGPDWTSKLMKFDYEPMAAASIGQVHKAVTTDGLEAAMKIQYPGVADSIGSDIENVKLLLKYTNLIPEKLFFDNVMKNWLQEVLWLIHMKSPMMTDIAFILEKVAKKELTRECDYVLEAESQKRFRKMLTGMEGFYVPAVVDVLSSKRVLTTELVAGIPIDKVALLDRETRNNVATKLLQLTLMELFVFRFMQTDPNWSNFLYDESKKTINLIDFGAAQEYPKHFVDDYLQMVMACADNDREAVIEMSKKLGFLTGMESEMMLDAHVQAGFIVGLPFAKPGGYDFSSTNITTSLSNLGATMLRHRLTAPPEEAYSLHRKLSGAFLACIKLGAVVPCRELLLEVYENYQFGNDRGESIASKSL